MPSCTPGPDETDLDGDGWMPCEGAGDCDDDDATRYPDATELCDGLDNDCDGAIPASETDQDGDGFAACEGDCDDGDPSSSPADLDGDGYSSCAGDCDDDDPQIHPGAVELCDGLDGDCDGNLPADEQDADGDGMWACAGDCDDADPAMHDHDLDGDGASPCGGDCDDADALLNALDLDGDGHTTCAGDCADDDAAVHPAAFDACDGLDNDCDGNADNPPDADGDGAGICDEYPDCDDTDATIHPVWVEAGVIGGLGTVSQPFGSIQSAVSVEHCGTVLLREGVYSEGTTILMDAAGPVEIRSVDGPRLAILDGDGAYRIMEMTGDPVTLHGLVLRNGYDPFAGAIFSDVELEISDCLFQGNESQQQTLRTGAVFVTDADLFVDSSEFYLNRGWSGSIHGMEAQVVVTDSVFGGNGGDFGNFGPGGILISLGQLQVFDSLFFENISGGGSGIGAYLAIDVQVQGSQFVWNECNFYGCGIHLDGVSAFSVVDCEFEGNRNDYGNAGAIFIDESSGTVSECRFESNYSLNGGGGIWTRDSEVEIRRSWFLGNNSAEGGAIYTDGGTIAISNSVFDANTGAGSVLYSDVEEITLHNNTWYDNPAGTGSGMVMFHSIPMSIDIQNNICFAFSEYCFECSGTLSGVDYNCYEIVGPPMEYAPGCTVNGTDNVYATDYFYAASPDLDPLNDDLRLLWNHAAVDRGNPDPQFNDPDGTRNDMGAYGGPEALP